MKAKTIATIEASADRVAAASLAASLGYAVTALGADFTSLPVMPGLVASAIAFAGALGVLTRIAPPVALTRRPIEADSYPPPDMSRVIRLFDRQRQPGAGELLARIDRHPAARPRAEAKDDSAALFDALNQLRGNLR